MKRTQRKLVQATWDVLKLAEWTEKHYPNSVVPSRYLQMFYSGDAVNKILTKRISDVQRWGVTLTVTALSQDGELHTSEIGYRAEQPIDFNGFVHQVSRLWIDTVDNDLDGMDCQSVVATARALVSC